MKKLLFVITLIGIFVATSCKKEANADTTEDNTEVSASEESATSEEETTVDSSANDLGVEVPEFQNEDIATWASNLIAIATDTKNAAEKGDEVAKNEGVAKLVESAKQLASFQGDPEAGKAQELFDKVKNLLENL